MNTITPFYQSEDSSFKLYQGDTCDIMSGLHEKFDMIFADPPYFLSSGDDCVFNGTKIKFDKGEWDRKNTQEEKNEFNRKWLQLCYDRLKVNGTIWVSGTYHNIFSVAECLTDLGFKILNVIVWQKSDAHPSLTVKRFNFTHEYIIWAKKANDSTHYFNYDLMKNLAGGKQMPDVWRLPSATGWEKTLGKHPTQKTLRLLYRIILSCTHEDALILDPFAGSCTTGIAAHLLNRRFVGIDMDQQYLDLGKKRFEEILQQDVAEKMFRKMSENPEEVMVLVNHARKETMQLMIEKGVCYMRAGDSQGSLQITPGFERMQYVCLHTGGEDIHFYRLKQTGTFQIWTKETLEKHGFHPEHAPYYVVLPFDNTKEIEHKKLPQLKQKLNTYRAKIRPLSDFIGIK